MDSVDRIKNNSLLPSEKLSLEHTIKLARKRDLRNSLMIECCYRTGFRASEILSLTPKSLVTIVDELDDGTRVEAKAIKVLTLKRNKRKRDEATGQLIDIKKPKKVYRTVIVSDEFYDRLLEYSLGLNTNDALFPISYDRMRQIWELYTPHPRITLHGLRHTYAKTHYRKSKDLQAIKDDLGHSNIQSTMVYAVVETPLMDRKRYVV